MLMKVSNILLWVFSVIIWLQITLYMVFTSKGIEIVEIARNYIKELGGFEKFAEWGLF